MARLGMICVPRTVRLAVEMARVAEQGGLWGLGIGDSQARYMEVYSVATACLLNTSRLVVGPIVTNPVTRHWTVHAAAARALDEVAPGRYTLGFAAGNSSVRSIDSAPAKPQTLATDLARMRSQMPGRVRVLIAADGPHMAVVAGQHADGLIIGTGLDPVAIAHLWGVARSARQDAGIDHPLEPWVAVPLRVVEHERDLSTVRAQTVGVAISMARRALSGRFDGKNVPGAFQPVLRERLRQYDMRHHASVGGDNPNDRLLADHPEIETYLAERFGLVGTPEMCRARLQAVSRETGISDFWFSGVVEDPVENLRLAADAFRPLMAADGTSEKGAG